MISLHRRKLFFLFSCLTAALFSCNLNSEETTDKNIQRLISTDASVTELIFALGLDNQLVAIDVTSQLPKGYKELPNIGYHRNLSAEGLLSLSPSAVIGTEGMGPPPVLSALKAAKVKLITLKSAKNLKTLEENITQISQSVDAEEKGKSLLTDLYADKKALNTTPLTNMNVAFVLNMRGHSMRLAGSETSGSAFIQLLGSKNVAEFKNYQSVTTESLMAINPDVILIAGQEKATAVETLLEANPILAHSKAAKEKRILAVDGSALVAGLSLSAIKEALNIHQLIQSTYTQSVSLTTPDR